MQVGYACSISWSEGWGNVIVWGPRTPKATLQDPVSKNKKKPLGSLPSLDRMNLAKLRSYWPERKPKDPFLLSCSALKNVNSSRKENILRCKINENYIIYNQDYPIPGFTENLSVTERRMQSGRPWFLGRSGAFRGRTIALASSRHHKGKWGQEAICCVFSMSAQQTVLC